MRALLLAPFLLATALLAGCTSEEPGPGGAGSTSTTGTGAHGGSTSHDGGDGMVHLVDDEFQDGDRTVPVGTSIRYMNTGDRPHTVTIHWVGEPAHVTRMNQTLQPDQDVTFTFDQAGTYHVWCRFHGTMTSGMASTVTVN